MQTRCSYDICNNPSLLKGLCDRHYLEQYVAPLQKERRNLEQALEILNSNIKEHSQALMLERTRARGIVKPERFLRETPNGWTNSGMVFCHKCWSGFESGIECIQHEEQCSGAKRRASNTGHKTATVRAPKVVVELVEDDSEINSEV